jgi:hypothetical protein
MDPKDLPAFPALMKAGDIAVSEGGMTLRDYFAAAALPGLMARNWSHINGSNEQKIIDTVAESAYRIADAMLAAREAT